MAARFDVAVVGGGSAGVAAALAAAGQGARTLLIERAERLGGNASLALVHTICGLYESADAADTGGGPVEAHPGLPRRFARLLREAGAAGPPERAGRVWVLPTEPAGLAACAAGCCARAPGLELRLRRELVGLDLSRDGLGAQSLLLAAPDGAREAVEAGAVVDASGDAAAVACGGAAFALAGPERLQRPSFVFRVAGVPEGALVGFERLRVSVAAATAARRGALPPGCESVLVRPALAPGEAHVTLNLPAEPGEAYEPLDERCLARLDARARRHAELLAAHLRAERAGFGALRIRAWPARVGVRETRRAVGRLELTREQVLGGERHPDEVAVSTWPIELWHDHRRARFEYPRAACSVPLGALVSRSHPRLAAAGRCLSASHEALGALRVIGTALATGEAAGVAAALAVDAGKGLDAVAAREVRARIEEGAERAL